MKRRTRTAERPAPPAAAATNVVPLRARSLTDEAYERIEEQIVTLVIAPGAAVSEAMLSERLGIGRTPVREALQRLAREQLVVALPQRGYLISEIDIRKQLRLLETRREVEGLIVRCAARRGTLEELQRFGELAVGFERSARDDDTALFVRIDREFNDACLHAARNEFAAGAMGLMHALARRFWFWHSRQAHDMPDTARLHGAIARAISLRDEDGAAAALDALLDSIAAFTRTTVTDDY